MQEATDSFMLSSIVFSITIKLHPGPDAGNTSIPETPNGTDAAPVGKKPASKAARMVPPKDGTARKTPVKAAKAPETGAGHTGGPRFGGRLRFEDGRLWFGNGNAPRGHG